MSVRGTSRWRQGGWWTIAALLAATLLGCGTSVGWRQGSGLPTRPICSVYFSPRGGCTEAIIASIDGARRSIRVQAYSFTSEPIAQALIRACRRGVQVEVILDKSQRTERFSRAALLESAGIPVMIDAAHAIAHNKVMIIDDRTVLTGSFNFTQGAEARNAENLLKIDDEAVAANYGTNWRAHHAHAVPYRLAVSDAAMGHDHHNHAPIQ